MSMYRFPLLLNNLIATIRSESLEFPIAIKAQQDCEYGDAVNTADYLPDDKCYCLNALLSTHILKSRDGKAQCACTDIAASTKKGVTLFRQHNKNSNN